MTRSADRHRSARLWLAAAALPCVAAAASVFVHIEPSAWLTMPDSVRRGVTADALLYIAAALILAAPLAGVVTGTAGRPDGKGPARTAGPGVTGPLVIAVLVFVASSAVVTLLGWGQIDRPALQFVAASHATLGAVGLALAAFGAFCGALFRDPLDAAAVSIGVVLLATGGLLVAGASVGDLPQAWIHAGLTASPLVAITAAAEIDIVRMGLPYQISPLAHLQVDYPTWYTASGCYLVVAVLCFAGYSKRVSA